MPENHNQSVIEPPHNGQIDLKSAQSMMQDFASVNLDEVDPGVIKVAFREFEPGKDGKGFTVTTLTKEINSWVPMFLFNRMLANQKKMQKQRRQQLIQAEMTAKDEPKEEAPDLLVDEELDFTTLSDELFKEIISTSEPALVWQAREVLAVWKLTPGEEGMSLKRLMLGLSTEFIQGLFMRFFGAMLLQKSKA